MLRGVIRSVRRLLESAGHLAAKVVNFKCLKFLKCVNLRIRVPNFICINVLLLISRVKRGFPLFSLNFIAHSVQFLHVDFSSWMSLLAAHEGEWDRGTICGFQTVCLSTN
jgi:hypothetical protein